MVNYINNKTKVKIIYKSCGKILELPPNAHLLGCGCKSCKLRKSQQQFLNDMKNIYGDKLDFSKSIYKTMDKSIIDICPEHGEFSCLPTSLYRGCGCPFHKGIRKNEFQFIKEMNDIYGDRYDLTNLKYKGTHYRVNITCNKYCRKFQPIARQILRGYRCDCDNPKINSLERFVEKAKSIHNDKYDYSETIYKGRHYKLQIKCNAYNNYFWQKAGDHLSGQGCPYCNGTPRKSTNQFIKEAKNIHGDRYDYSLVEYINNHSKVEIICKNCGEHFFQTLNSHLFGQNGCPNCQKKSLAEEYIANFLKAKDIFFIRNKKYNDLRDVQQLSYDFYLSYYNLLIEYNGQQHYCYFKKYHKTLQDFHRQFHHD